MEARSRIDGATAAEQASGEQARAAERDQRAELTEPV
jgi:hypothetical protein